MTVSSNDRELLSLIAHELRSPAAVVAGYMRLLLKEDPSGMPERARRMIQEADRSCARVLSLIRELSDLASLSKSDLGPCTPVPVFSMCAEVVETADAAGASTFSCMPEDQAALVQGDASRLKQALEALLSATLRERGGKALEMYGFVSRDEAPPRAVVALGDPGISLLADQVLASRTSAFDPFRGGTGLSVPIACRIVDGCGGQLWSIPEHSRAACAFSLPIWQAPIDTDHDNAI
jgi:signal transduction histidine kinase